jgi:aspartyl-tRNA(Asn)/glutamyl-tRNA(Gln) amidotransferase subunit A
VSALAGLSIAEMRRAVAAREISPVALAEGYLERIEELDGVINAFRTVTREYALAQAQRVEDAARRGDPLGPLAGVPIALKDNIGVAGIPMTAGTPHLGAGVPEADAPVWERLSGAGAVLLGKLHLSEWAIGGTTQNFHYGPCRNPWDLERIAGGSSGGSGAAVAAGMAAATIGTDTAGSIRIPAGLVGVCGLRGTVGRVSNRGSIPVAWTFDTIGPMARRAEDVARLLAVIAGYDREDPGCVEVAVDDYAGALAREAEGLRVGLLTGSWLEGAEGSVVSAVRDAAVVLARAGAHVEEVELEGHEEAITITGELVLAEAAWFHRERLERSPELFGPDVLVRLRRGAAISGPRYGYGRQRQRVWRRRVVEALAGRDVLLVAGTPMPAPPLAASDPVEMTATLGRFLSPWALAGTPALALPSGFADGLPVGAQLVGRPFEEATVLRAAYAYQRETDWHLRAPPALAAAIAGRDEGGPYG